MGKCPEEKSNKENRLIITNIANFRQNIRKIKKKSFEEKKWPLVSGCLRNIDQMASVLNINRLV